MALWICSACERHVQPDTTRCPFCETSLGVTSAVPQRVALVAALGLALVGCGDKDEETGGEQPTTHGLTDSDGDTESSGVGSVSVTASDTDAGGEDYAGPETDEWGGNEPPPDTDESSGTGDTDTDTDTDTDGSTGTDTGSSVTDTEDDAGGQDYAGAAPDA